MSFQVKNFNLTFLAIIIFLKIQKNKVQVLTIINAIKFYSSFDKSFGTSSATGKVISGLMWNIA